MRDLTASDLCVWLDDPSRPVPLLLDVRELWEVQICHIRDSITIPMNSIPEHLPRLERSRPIVCICHHGMRSALVGRYLQQQGFDDVSNLAGGIDAWARQVDPDMPTY